MVPKENELVESLENQIIFRSQEIKLLYKLLFKTDICLHPLIHLYGLSGTGKTAFITNMMRKLTNKPPFKRISVYLNAIEFCNLTFDFLLSEIITQIEKNVARINGESDYEETEEEQEKLRVNDESTFCRYLNKYLADYQLYIVIDHCDYLKNLNSDLNQFMLFITKLNTFLSNTEKVAIVMVSEIDWNSLISECEIMSQTDSQKPVCIFFKDYTKEQMYEILVKKNQRSCEKDSNKTLYIHIILEVFYYVCKDLNEINYLIESYYQQISMMMSSSKSDSNVDSMKVWNKMKPFLRQALTKIYLREAFDFNSQSNDRDNISKELESLNIASSQSSFLSQVGKTLATNTENQGGAVQLPLLIRYLLISAYLATHNSSKYDKKLFDYMKQGSSRGGGGLKFKFSANQYQKIDEKQHEAAMKMHQFDINRLMAIFHAITTNELKNGNIEMNLGMIQCELQTLKNLHLIQQTSSASYSCLDEPKYKCLIDFDSIQEIANSVQFSIKQYLSEYFL